MSLSPKHRVLIMLPLLLGAGWLALFGDKTPGGGSQVVAPVVQPRGVAPAAVATEAPPEDPAIMGEVDRSQVRRLRDRLNLAELENGPQVDLFSGRDGEANPALQGANAAPADEAPAQPFVLIGRMFDHDHWLAFLEREGKTYVVQARDVIEGFRIDALTGKEIRLTQLADKSRFVIPIDGEKKESAHD
ncbi:MAG: hypothetical protein H6R19_1830 [Proteobacteria bacterium]|nr:hypothetical protein [Pseudomonadota bacterium]